jgi:hypothetical protein
MNSNRVETDYLNVSEETKQAIISDSMELDVDPAQLAAMYGVSIAIINHCLELN